MTDAATTSAIEAYQARKHELTIFMSGVREWFGSHPDLQKAIHSVKSRLKDESHLREKLTRKAGETVIDGNNLFERITDLAGVRILHLHQAQVTDIHNAILHKVTNLGDWHFVEPPKAYTWDPESKEFFEGLGITPHLKDSFYTSVHYLIRPRADSLLCCEIQVRTLFEEIWGEIDHTLNYPTPSTNLACREQLRVLSKLVGAGSRLVDSIIKSAANS